MPAVDNLPSIVEFAEQHGVVIHSSRKSRRGDLMANCPFCHLNGHTMNTEYSCYLHPVEQCFRCQRCGEKGGVFKFMALLTNRDVSAVTDEWKQAKRANQPERKPSSKPKYPGASITIHQMRLMGFLPSGKTHRERFKMDATYRMNYLNWVWQEWQSFLQDELYKGFQVWSIAVAIGKANETKIQLQERSKEIGYDILSKILEVYSSSEWPLWAKEAMVIVNELLKQNGDEINESSDSHWKLNERSGAALHTERNSSYHVHSSDQQTAV